MNAFRCGAFVAFLLLLSLPAAAHLANEPLVAIPVPDPLSAEQRAWLTAHPLLRLAPDPDFRPIEFFNEHGDYSGMAADYAHLLEHKLGCRFTVVRCATWSEVLRRAERREVDVLNAAVPTPERARYLLFAPAYLHMPMVIFTRRDGERLRVPADLAGRRVALVRNYGHAELIAREVPGLIAVPVADAATGLRLASSGQVDAFYHDHATAGYLIERDGITNLRISGRGSTDNNSGFAVRSDWPELAGILARGMELVTPAEHRQISARWLHPLAPEAEDWREYLPDIASAVAAFASILLLALLANVLLKREVRRRTQELSEREQLLRSALKIGQMGYGSITAAGAVFWSPEVRRLHGLSPDEPLTPQGMGAHIHPDDRAKLLQLRDVLKRGEYAPGLEYRVLLPNGRTRWLYGEWQATFDRRGRYAGVIGITQDITARKEHELELQREKEFSENILGVQRDTVVIVELDTGRLVRWNRRAVEISGYSDDDLAGSIIEQAHPPEQRDRVHAALAELRAGRQVTLELDLLTRDGRRIPHEYSIDVMPHPDGPPRFCCSVGRDISERTAAAAALRQERDFNERILNAQRDTVTIVDLTTGKVVRWNRRALEVSGYTAEEMPVLTLAQTHPADQHERAFAAMAELQRGGGRALVELDLLTKDGRRIPYEYNANVLADVDGKSQYLCVVGRDISERTAAAAALRASEEKFRLLAENTVDVIWSSNLKMETTYISPSVQRLLGYTPEEFIGLGPGATITPESLRLVSAALQEELAREAARPGSGGERNLSIDHRHRDGSIVNTEISTAFIRDGAGQVTGVTGVTRDVTERLRIQREFDRAQAMLQAAIDQSPMGVIVADAPDGTIRLVSAAAREILGLAPDESALDLPLTQYAASWRALRADGSVCPAELFPLARALRGESAGSEEMLIVRHDGSRRWILANAAPVHDRQGSIVAAIIIFADRSVQHLVQRSLAESETRLRAVLDSIPFDLWMMDAAGHYIEQNEVSRKLWGDIRGKTPSQVARDSGQAEHWLEQNRRVLAGEDLSGEVDYRVKGENRHFLYLLRRIGDSANPLGIVGANIDITERKRAEAALRESEMLYRSLIETTNTGFVIVSGSDGAVIDANPLYVAMTGHRSLDDIRGRQVTEWTAPYDRERNACAVRDCFATGSVRNLVIDYQHADGTIVPIEINASVLQTSSGRVIQTLCRDVSERRQSEERLRASEHEHRMLIEQAQDGILLLGPDGRFIMANSALCRMLGYAMHELLGRHILDTYPEELKRQGGQRLAKIQDGEAMRAERPMLRKDGSSFPIELHAIRLPGGRMQAIVRDISERKRHEAERLASEQRYRAIFEHCGTALLFVAEDTTILMCNREFERLSGFSRAEVEGKRSWTEHIADPADLERMRDYNRRRRSGGEGVPVTYEVAMLDRHGRRREMAISVVLVPETGQSLCAMLDISERKRAEERVRRMNEELTEANRKLRSLDELKSNLLANVTHELRSPLVAVRGYAELIREGVSGPVNETQRTQFDVMLRNIDRLLELIGNLLDFSRHEHGNTRLAASEFVVAELLGEVHALLLPRAVEKQVTLELVAPPPALRLSADHHLMQQVMINLVDNALKFTPAGGKVTMGAAAGEGDTVSLTVSDTGIGIPAGESEHIFERFYQIDSSSTRVYGGTGIGLAIAREIVELHGGRISVTSRVGAGSTFTVTLPGKPIIAWQPVI